MNLKCITFAIFSFISLALFSQVTMSHAEKEEAEHKAGIEYFRSLRYPYGEYSPEQQLEIWEAIDKMPREERERGGLGWKLIGPSGAKFNPADGTTSTRTFTGRVRGLAWVNPNVQSDIGLRVLSATAGLWRVDKPAVGDYTAVFMSGGANGIKANDFGSFACHPNNPDTIWVGTGEPGANAGTGLWKSENNGATWTRIDMDTAAAIPGWINELVYDPVNPQIIHAATNLGYQRSIDGGATWVRLLTGGIVSIIINPHNPQVLYCGLLGTGVMRSNDGGNTWQPSLTSFPTSPGEIALSICAADTAVVYTCVSSNTNPSNTVGIYKTNTSGSSWQTCNYFDINQGQMNAYSFHWNQGFWNNMIAVSPYDPDKVVCGGGAFLRSSDGFNFYEQDGAHADQHVAIWKSPGSMLLGNDGGVYLSDDDGATFYEEYNIFPITQFVGMEVGDSNPKGISGGTQDNGGVYSKPSNGEWYSFQAGDGFSGAIHPTDPNRMSASVNTSVWVSDNGGDTWIQEGTFCVGAKSVRHERSNTILFPFTDVLLANCNNQVFYRDILGVWTAMMPTPFATGRVIDGLSVSNRQSTQDANNIYTYLRDVNGILPPQNERIALRWRNDGLWYLTNNTAGLPSDTWYRVVTHPKSFDIAYAICMGTPASGNAGQKIFRTNDAAINWVDISGNLPNVPIQSLVADPNNPDKIVIGTVGFGAFQTNNNGTSWSNWNYQLPENANITAMDYIDSTSINGKLYVVASTYGHSMWKREWTSSDPISVTPPIEVSPLSLSVSQTWEECVIRVATPRLDTDISLQVFDISGKVVAKLYSGKSSLLPPSFIFPKNKINSGIYIVVLGDNVGNIKTQKLLKE